MGLQQPPTSRSLGRSPLKPGTLGRQVGRWSSILDRLFARARPKCSQCGGVLLMRNWIRATCVDEHGRRYPDSWVLESCEGCGARTKRHLDGRIEVPSDEEC